MKKKTLFLTLQREWFEMIASGEKKIEIRGVTKHWLSRLSKRYDEILFQNGYHRNAPRMRVEFLGLIRVPPHCFGILLGRVLELKNWPPCSKQSQQSAQTSSPSLQASRLLNCHD